MRARLLHPDAAFAAAHPNEGDESLFRDLELEPIVAAMADRDPVIDRVARAALRDATDNTLATIEYRQAVLADCRRQPERIRRLYALACSALAAEGNARRGLKARLSSVVVRSATEILSVCVDHLERLRQEQPPTAEVWRSRGLNALAATLEEALPDDAIAAMRDHLRQLHRRRDLLVSAHLGAGNKPVGYRLRRLSGADRNRLRRRLPGHRARYRIPLQDDDDRSREALRRLREERLAPLAQSMRRTCEDVEGFLEQLRDELGFYVGCLNLEAALEAAGVATVLPELRSADERAWQVSGLSDAALALVREAPVVTNDLAADGCRTLVVTGANQGGKSTFLRSLGQAQLMAQAGFLVAAAQASLSRCDAVLTHFPRPEDPSLRRGKLDEELARLSACIDALTPATLLLSNESLAVTNQREGARILADVAAAVHDYGARAVYVSHLKELATDIGAWASPHKQLLRAERGADGARNFRIVPGAPEVSSYGRDLYDRIIGRGGMS